MFCSECGAKNPDGASFCDQCGAKLEATQTVKNEPKKEEKAEPKKQIAITKKQKALIILALIVLVALFVVYQVISSQTSPAKLVNKYMDAVQRRDYHTLYELAEFSDDNAFITEEAFSKVLEENLKNLSIQNYTVGKDITYENAGLKVAVPVNITATDTTNSSTKEFTIELSKLPSKKFIFFNNWKLENMSLLLGYDIVKDYKIIVPKSTKITFAGVTLDDTYLDKEESDQSKSTNTYKIPQMFNTDKVDGEFEIFGNVKIKREIPISTYNNEYRLTVSEEDINLEEEEKMKTVIKDNLNTVMNAVIAKKSFDEIQGNFAEGDSDYYTSTRKVYENQIKYMERLSYTVSDFNITDIIISKVSVDSTNFNISVRMEVDYTWKATSTQNGTTKDANDRSYITYDLVYKDGAYKPTHMSEIPSLYVWM